MPAEELARKISYVCSYSEWFGMAELGSCVGKFSEFDGQKVIMYSWINTGEMLYFIQANKVNTCLKRADGEMCPVYINEMGNMEFYKLERKQFPDSLGQMDTSMITMDELSPYFIESLIRIGETEKMVIEDLTKLEMPSVEEERFVGAFTQQVEELLERAEKEGTYTVRIGEYDSVYSNQVCISAAVTGEHDEYYFRYLIVGYGDDQYYFWPVGFGTDGSLEECASEKHGMNQKCIERTKLLNRTEIKIVLSRKSS